MSAVVESFHASQVATAMALEQNMELVRVEHSMVARAGRLAGGCACAPRGERGDALALPGGMRLRSQG